MKKSDKDPIAVEFGPLFSDAQAKGESIVLLDAQGHLVEAHAYGNFVEKIDGGMRLTRPDGVSVSVIDGEMFIENLVPKAVGIRDLSEVESFSVKVKEQARTCRVEFQGGGHLQIVYSPDGQVMELSGHNLKQTLSKDNTLVFAKGDSAHQQ